MIDAPANGRSSALGLVLKASSAARQPPTSTVDLLRLRGVVGVAILGWVSLAIVIAVSLWMGGGTSLSLLVVGTLVNLAPTAMALRGRYDKIGRAHV